MLYVVKENEDQIEILSVTIRCTECGNVWQCQLGRDLTAPEGILQCYRCAAREAAEQERERRMQKQEVRNGK